MSLTLAAPARHEQVVKHSRFLAQAVPVTSPEEAVAALTALSDAAATHNCWAWRVGERYRSSDDGEPGGTAGRPILAAIDGRGLDGVLVVVTRWFGGIKLGAGGLVRAYGGAAAECLRTAAVVEVRRLVTLGITAGFADLGAVHGLLDRLGVQRLGEDYAPDAVTLRVSLDEAEVEAFQRALADATRGRVQGLVAD
ncbi:MAG: YigZ family protein [Pseudomonadota bacterium]